MLVVLPEAENSVSPEGETNRSWTTVSELELPLPEGGLGREETCSHVTGGTQATLVGTQATYCISSCRLT